MQADQQAYATRNFCRAGKRVKRGHEGFQHGSWADRGTILEGSIKNSLQAPLELLRGVSGGRRREAVRGPGAPGGVWMYGTGAWGREPLLAAVPVVAPVRDGSATTPMRNACGAAWGMAPWAFMCAGRARGGGGGGGGSGVVNISPN